MEFENPKPSTDPKPEEEQHQPDAKKLKMSTTTSDNDENHDNVPAAAADDGAVLLKKPRYKRRKIAIFFAFCGVGYQGMQKNPGAKTIEGELEEALYHSGAVPEQQRGRPKQFDFARSARTDKGVSAVGQVVSGRFYVDPPRFVERLNSKLPPPIRIFGFKRTTGAFSAKKFCDRRRYVYLIPVFALDPSRHRDRESVIASVGSENELVKCLECSERGRKVVGVMGKRNFRSKSEPAAVSVDSSIKEDRNIVGTLENGNDETDDNNKLKTEALEANIISNTSALMELDNEDKNIIEISENGNGNDEADDNKLNGGTVEASIMLNSSVLLESENLGRNMIEATENGNGNGGTDDNKLNTETVEALNSIAVESDQLDEDKVDGVNGNEKQEKRSEFSYGEKEKERLNRILKYYEGTHNFHNFTTRTKAEDPSANRYIISFNANTTVNIEGIEFVKCEVIGQSFMLHQIRKMIGLAVAIIRDIAPESLIETAFEQNVNINVPMAPEVGLYLDECFFTSYNQRWKDHEELSMKDYAKEAEEFKMKWIYSHIASTEHKDGAVAVWLHSLNYRNYPDLQGLNIGQSTDKKGSEAVDNGQSTDMKGNEVMDNGQSTDMKGNEVMDNGQNVDMKRDEAVNMTE